jgi:dTDP-4-dehydrorhamnose reductase
MRILITGGSSYLGRHLAPLAAAQGHEICHTYFSQDALGDGRQLDLRDETAVQTLLRDFQPEAIIHTAGSNRSPDMTAVIIQAAQNLVKHGAGARLVHLSSDVVFDGRKGTPYRESDPPSPCTPTAGPKRTPKRLSPNIPTRSRRGLPSFTACKSWIAVRNGSARP